MNIYIYIYCKQWNSEFIYVSRVRLVSNKLKFPSREGIDGGGRGLKEKLNTRNKVDSEWKRNYRSANPRCKNWVKKIEERERESKKNKKEWKENKIHK